MTRTRSILLVFILIGPGPAMAAWTTRAPDESGLDPVAYIANDAGQRAEVFLVDGDIVYLRLVLGEGFETFAESSCPTFQIDKRIPMHHFAVGQRCAIAAKNATIQLGKIVDREIESLVLHRFMNGNRVTFRYTIHNGQYREASFSLRSSKQALLHAIGADSRVLVD